MRRHLILVAAAATAAAVAWPADAGTTRTATRTYTAALTAVTPNGYAQGSGVVIQGVQHDRRFGLTYVKLRPSDRRMSIQLTDQSGRVVQAMIQQTARDGSVATVGVVCGASRHPLSLAPGGGTLIVRPSYGMCGSEASLPTTGIVRVQLSR